MPNTTVRRERRGPVPAAVLTLIGNYYAVNHGWSPGVAHILGPPGPRGGRRTVCGRSRRSDWDMGSITFPVNYRDEWRWRYVCTDCKQGLGGVLNA